MKIKLSFNLSSIKSLFLILVVIVNSGYMLQVSDSPLKLKIQYFTIYIFVFLLFDYLILKLKILERSSSQNKFILISLSALISMVANFETYKSYVSYIAIIFIAFYIVSSYENKDIAITFVNVTVLLSLISLFYLIRIKYFGIPYTKSIITAGISVNQYYDYKIFFYPKLFISGFGRNSGLFWEPGLHASILIFAMMLEILYKETVSFLKISILFITLLSTKSTGGIILLLPVFLLFIDRKINNSTLRIFIPIILWINVLMLFLFQDQIITLLAKVSPTLFSKLINHGSTKSTRLMSPILNVKIFQSHPIFGAGLIGGTKLYIENKKAFSVDSQTSTTFAMLAYFGLLGILYTVWWISGILKNLNATLSQKITLLIVIFIILNKEPHLSIMATWIIFFMFQGENSENVFNKEVI